VLNAAIDLVSEEESEEVPDEEEDEEDESEVCLLKTYTIFLNYPQSSESEEEVSKPLFRPVFVPKYVSNTLC
jgi:microfibrillar-associated protein 1